MRSDDIKVLAAGRVYYILAPKRLETQCVTMNIENNKKETLERAHCTEVVQRREGEDIRAKVECEGNTETACLQIGQNKLDVSKT